MLNLWSNIKKTGLQLAVVGAFISSCYVLVTTIQATFDFLFPGLYMDEWDTFLSLIQSNESLLGLSHWLFQCNMEHVILIPRLHMLFEWEVFKSGNLSLIVAICINQLLFLLLIHAYLKKQNLHSSSRWALFFIGSIALFSASQLENFTWAFQIQFVQVYFFAACSLYFFGFSPLNSGFSVFVSVAFATAASLSMSNGLLVFPLLLWGMVHRKKHWSWSLGVLIVFLMLIGLYAYQHNSSKYPSIDHLSAFSNLDQVIAFFFAYLINPLSEYFPNSSVWIGLIYFVGLCFGGFCVIRSRRYIRNRGDFFLITYLMFLLGTAIVTSMGRYAMGVEQAGSDRYATPSLLILAFSIIWFVQILRQTENLTGVARAVLVFIVSMWTVCLAVVVAQQPLFIEKYRALHIRKQIAINSIRYDCLDTQFSESIYTNLQRHEATIEVLKQTEGLQEYYLPHTLKKGMGKGERLSRRECISNWNFVKLGTRQTDEISYVLTGDFEIDKESDFQFAYVWEPDRQKIIGAVYNVSSLDAVPFYPFVRSDDRAVFYGHALIPVDVDLNNLELLSSDLTKLYTPTQDYSQQFLERNTAVICEFDEPPEHQFGVLSIVPEKPTWTPNGYFPDNLPPEGLVHVYGSWSGKDDHAGKLVMRFDLENQSSFFLSAITGPVVPDGEIIVRSLPDGEQIAHLEMPKITRQWRYLHIQLPEPKRELELEINEKGTGWGQWMAVSAPLGQQK
ncbi:MAG: DMT family transporter [Opitutales bacterium]|nr:DMT family transporter [Opitutales bacterium]